MSQKYTNPPIVEAILDIQVAVSPSITMERLQKSRKGVKKDYPSAEPLNQVMGRFEYAPESGASAAASQKMVGYKFSSSDKKQIAQVKTSGFTYNRLAPYGSWEAFRAEALRLWNEYYKVARPTKYEKIALRYINRFDIPKNTVETTDYFLTGPTIAPDLPQVFHDYFFSVVIPVPSIDGAAKIVSTLPKPMLPGTNSFILDIEIFTTEGLTSGELIWPLFEKLRKEKNTIFEACITNAARELIQ